MTVGISISSSNSNAIHEVPKSISFLRHLTLFDLTQQNPVISFLSFLLKKITIICIVDVPINALMACRILRLATLDFHSASVGLGKESDKDNPHVSSMHYVWGHTALLQNIVLVTPTCVTIA
jgi:hypothetical protein